MKFSLPAKILAFTIFQIITFVGGHTALGGGETGGGGFAVVCPSGSPLKSPMLLDLYEYNQTRKDGYKIQLVPATGDTEKDEALLWQELVKIMDQSYLKLEFNTSLTKILWHNINLAKKKIAEQINDSRNANLFLYIQPDIGRREAVKLPRGCELLPVAFWNSKAQISVDLDIWNKFSITDRAALIVHEAIYAIRRLLFGDTQSEIARNHTATLVSNAQFSYHTYDDFLNNHSPVDFNEKGFSLYTRVIIPQHYHQLTLEAELISGKFAEVNFIDSDRRLAKVSLTKSATKAKMKFFRRRKRSQWPILRISGSKDCVAYYRFSSSGFVFAAGFAYCNDLKSRDYTMIDVSPNSFYPDTPVAPPSEVEKFDSTEDSDSIDPEKLK